MKKARAWFASLFEPRANRHVSTQVGRHRRQEGNAHENHR